MQAQPASPDMPGRREAARPHGSDGERRPVRVRPLLPAGGDHVRHLVGVARRGDKAVEGRRGQARPRLVLGVELHPQEEGVFGERQLDDVHALLGLVLSREDQAFGLHPLLVLHVELVAVSVPLLHARRAAVEARAEGRGGAGELDPAAPEAHVGAHGLSGDLGHEHQDVVLRCLALVELLAGGVREAQGVPRELDQRHLHAQADPEVGLLPLACEARSPGLALDAAVAEAARHEDAVDRAQLRLCGADALELLRVDGLRRGRLQVHGVDPLDLQLPRHRDGRVVQGGQGGLVGVVAALVVLAHEGDLHRLRHLCLVHAPREAAPVLQRAQGAVPAAERRGRDVQVVQVKHAVEEAYDVLLPENRGHVEEVLHVVRAEDARGLDVALVRDLLPRLLLDRVGASADDQVRLDAEGQESLDGVLRGLRLLPAEVGNVGDVAPGHGVLREAVLELPESLDEGHGLDVPDGPAELDHADLRPQAAAVHRLLRHAVQPFDDGAGDVGHDLNRLAQVLPAALLLDHVVVDLARGNVVVPAQRKEHHPLVVAEVQIGLTPVIENEDLPVLVRAHEARVDVDVGVHLDGGDPETVPPKEGADGGRRDTLPERAADTSGDDDVLHAPLHRGPEEGRGRRGRRNHARFQELVKVVRRRRRHRRQLLRLR
mmetsp:Transcript_30335/g.94157  ORF Transcript_30335/g.94157 Transcript_30335/m.94157 type:complete len:659 (+) Transcript_30335:177-2153(+)